MKRAIRLKTKTSDTKPQMPVPVERDVHSGFALRLQELVKDAGSTAAVAAQAGVSEGAVRMWLSRVEPTREKLASIAKASGVSLDWLISGRGPKVYSECPPGYIAMRFADLTKSKGVATRPFYSIEKFIFLPPSLLGIAEDDSDQIDPMALLLPPETPDAQVAEFIAFDMTREGASPPRPPTLCVTLDQGRPKVRPARSAAGSSDMPDPILGRVIFRGIISRPPKAKEKPQ